MGEDVLSREINYFQAKQVFSSRKFERNWGGAGREKGRKFSTRKIKKTS